MCCGSFAYSSCRLVLLKKLLGDEYSDVDSHNNLENMLSANFGRMISTQSLLSNSSG